MPTCAFTHRQRTGLFTGTLICILGKLAARYRRLYKYRGIKCAKPTIKVTIAVLFFELLLLCGDIESNPGPGPWRMLSSADFPPLSRPGAWVRGPPNIGEKPNIGSSSSYNRNSGRGEVNSEKSGDSRKISSDTKTTAKMSLERLHQGPYYCRHAKLATG